MSRTRVRIDPHNPLSLPHGRVDHAALDKSSEKDIAVQARENGAEASRAECAMIPSRRH